MQGYWQHFTREKVGPFVAISSISHWQQWAHSTLSAQCHWHRNGPIHYICLLLLDGPIHLIHLLLLDGPTWALLSLMTVLHMGSTDHDG